MAPVRSAPGVPAEERRGASSRRAWGRAANSARRLVEESGYTYNPEPDVIPNSRKALEVTELARDLGLEKPVHDRLMHAYWSEALNIGDEDVLLELVSRRARP